jgi:hypothetical protein
MAFGFWTVAVNWPDYRNTLVPTRIREGWAESKRLRKAEPGSHRG